MEVEAARAAESAKEVEAEAAERVERATQQVAEARREAEDASQTAATEMAEAEAKAVEARAEAEAARREAQEHRTRAEAAQQQRAEAEAQAAHAEAQAAQAQAQAAHAAQEATAREEALRREMVRLGESHAHQHASAEHAVELSLRQSQRRSTQLLEAAKAAEAAAASELELARREVGARNDEVRHLATELETERQGASEELRRARAETDAARVEAEAARGEAAEAARRLTFDQRAAAREAATREAAMQEEAAAAMSHAQAMHEERDHLESELRSCLRLTRRWAKVVSAAETQRERGAASARATDGLAKGGHDPEDAEDAIAEGAPPGGSETPPSDGRAALSASQIKPALREALLVAARGVASRIEAVDAEWRARLTTAESERDQLSRTLEAAMVRTDGGGFVGPDKLPELLREASIADDWPTGAW
jgi:hypothetical protein